MSTSIGDRIREARVRHGWSQGQLAAGLGLSDSYISLIESGRRQPRQQVLSQLADRLECSVDYLISGRDAEQSRTLELELRFAELALRTGDAQVARERFRDVRQRAEQLGRPYAAVAVEASWGGCLADEALGHLESAITGLERLVESDELPQTVSRTAVAMTLCRTYWQSGDLGRAIEVGEQGLRRLRTAGADTLGDEGIELGSTLVACYYERGDITRAHLLAADLIATVESGASARARGAAYWNAALVAEARGDLRSAQTMVERALALYGEVDHRRALALLRLTSAWVMLRQEKPQLAEATALLEHALAEFVEVGNPVDLASTETELSRCALLGGEPERAADLASTAIGRLADAPRLETSRARAALADAQLALGDLEGALTSYRQAAADLGTGGASRQAATMWRELGDALAALGRADEAMAAYRQATEAVGIRGRSRPTAGVAAQPAAERS